MITNKKYVWIGVIVIAILLVIAGSLFFNRDKNVQEESSGQIPGDINQEEAGLATQSNQEEADLATQSLTKEEYDRIIAERETYSSPVNQKEISYQYVKDLDKESCLGLESEFFKDNCINGIDLIEEALKQNDIELCHDSSYDVDSRVILICTRKLIRSKLNEQ